MITLPDKELFRVDEVAEYFTVTVKTVYRWIDKGALISIKIGGIVRISREAILNCETYKK
jgi:excisionase family DNA binding protein